jgi:hypothetical protein
MLDKNKKQMWSSLQKIILDMDQDESLSSIFTKIAEWTKQNQKNFANDLMSLYGVNELLELCPDEYPIHLSETTLDGLKNLTLIEPSKEESMIMILRDTLWEIVTLKVDTECPRCEHDLGLFTLFDSVSNKIILECPQCGWLQTADNEYYEPLGKLRIAKSKDLITSGLLKE